MGRPFRVGIVGCGQMANTWVTCLQREPDVEIVALADLDLARAREMGVRHGLEVPLFAAVEDLLDEARPNLVVDTAIPEARREICVAALERGCDVMAEKPFAPTRADAEAILDAVARSGRRYLVMQNRRYEPHLRAIRRAIEQGLIGRVEQIHADFFIGAHFGGFREHMEHPLILDMAIHTFDQARFLLGGARAETALCLAYNPASSWYHGYASAVCAFEMEDGAVFSYRGSWSAEGFRTSWESTWRIVGSQGTVVWDGSTGPEADVVVEEAEGFLRPSRRVRIDVEPMDEQGHAACLREMLEALRTGRPAETESTDNVESARMMYAAIESAAIRAAVHVADGSPVAPRS
ncbi:Gfo/Idh/MocA family protein [Alicyclobacillus sendaiensis]|uniref:Gfo/Idh/MocA family oxidoreductase n=1 Tax=Alicyclobacillus sendaiensis PA2 TaxID=3029425 RepID=A0ABT6XV51_ALISE|nr:Gfo/Idh/MocA family oxidoreductase [Alicyclobacillus sendaiensis]MDI9258971.1 Gfo/Idh/MocA family oxidoreductase [Alicyclobacillus sendaiensis PA2]